MSAERSTPSGFLRNWADSFALVAAVVTLMSLTLAPMLLPLLLGETWWAFALMGLAYVVVISFLIALVESL